MIRTLTREGRIHYATDTDAPITYCRSSTAGARALGVAGSRPATCRACRLERARRDAAARQTVLPWYQAPDGVTVAFHE